MFLPEDAWRFKLILLHLLRGRSILLCGTAVLSLGLAVAGYASQTLQPDSGAGAALHWLALGVPFAACLCLCLSERSAFWEVHFVARGLSRSILFTAFAVLFATPALALLGSLALWSAGALAVDGISAWRFAAGFSALILGDYLLCLAITCVCFTIRAGPLETVILCGTPAILAFKGAKTVELLNVNYALALGCAVNPVSFPHYFDFLGGFLRVGETLTLSIGLLAWAGMRYASVADR